MLNIHKVSGVGAGVKPLVAGQLKIYNKKNYLISKVLKKNDLEKIGINHEEFLFVIWGGILKNQHRKKNTPIEKKIHSINILYFIMYSCY